MENCMIQSKGLSPHFLIEALNCANYIVNCTPTKALKDITLKEAKNKITLDSFCVFGSEVWAYIHEEKKITYQCLCHL
jgi:hypothetical protein